MEKVIKERRVYFDAKAKVHLKEYIDNRTDNNNALFVTLDAPHDRLKISGVEIRLRNLGKNLHLKEFIHINFGDQWQQEQSIRECRLNKCRSFWDILKLIQLCSMQWLINNVKTAHQKYMA